MRSVLAGLTAVALLGALTVPAYAATETVTGRIVDHACYMKDMANNADNDHRMPADTPGCAIACAKMGAAMSLLTSEGRVYAIKGDLMANMNAKIVPHVGHTVSITGDVVKAADGSLSITASELKMVSR